MQQLQFQLGLAQLDFQTEQRNIHFDHGLVALVRKMCTDISASML